MFEGFNIFKGKKETGQETKPTKEYKNALPKRDRDTPRNEHDANRAVGQQSEKKSEADKPAEEPTGDRNDPSTWKIKED